METIAQGQPIFLVHITNLPPDTTEESLSLLLSPCRTVEKIDLRADRHHPESRKFAFVSVLQESEAEKLVASLHLRELAENRVISARRFDPAVEEREDASIHVRNLPADMTQQALIDLFSVYGKILTAQLGQTDHPGGKGFGFVQFDTPESATNVLTQGNEIQFQGVSIRVEPYIPKPERKPATLNSVYVRGFGTGFTELQLKDAFSVYGEVQSCSISKAGRAFGFVNFAGKDAAEKAIQGLNGKTVAGTTWIVSPSRDRGTDERNSRRQKERQDVEWSKRNLYVSGLPPFVTEEMMRRLFLIYGEVESVRVQSHASYSFEENAKLQQELSSAYVCFRRQEDAEKALAEMSNILIEGHKIRVAKWKPIEVRKPVAGNQPLAQWLMFPSGSSAPRRHVPDRHPKRHPQKPHNPVPRPVSKSSFDILKYQSLSPDKKKPMIGEFIFWELNPLYKDQTGKITGMILEMSEPELLELVQDPKALFSKAAEAMAILKQHAEKIGPNGR